MTKQILSALKISVLALVLSFGLSYALAAWTPPAAQPPNGNVAAPINVGSTTQTKMGGDVCTTISGVTKCLQTAGGADNLGNHTATQALNMAGFNVNSAPNLIDTSATAQAKGGALAVGGELDTTGGTGTGYSTAPIEVRTTLTPRISFHWPGVVASQLGMDSAGTIRTYDNPGTGYANFTAGGITATNRLTVSEANGAYTYITLRDDESPNGVKHIHANSNVVGFLSGAGSWLSYWDNSGNQQNTGSVNASDFYVRATGKWVSTIKGFAGIYQTGRGGVCVVTNPYTGACSCPAGSTAYASASGITGSYYDTDLRRTVTYAMPQYACYQ